MSFRPFLFGGLILMCPTCTKKAPARAVVARQMRRHQHSHARARTAGTNTRATLSGGVNSPLHGHHGWSVVWLGQGGVSGDGRTDAQRVGADENEGEGPGAAGHAAETHRKRDRIQS
jgi:hypothetical protein